MPSLLSAINASASALDAQRVRMEVAVSNLANAESTRGPDGQPYRRREVVLRRLLIFGRTTQDFYGRKRQEFLAQYKQAQPQAEPADFKRNLPQEAVSNYGQSFAKLVVGTYQQDRIALSDAAQYLGVRAKHLPTVERMLRGGGLPAAL